MQFQVPQFLDVEDKIIGPFTIKQFLYLAGGVGMAYLAWRFIPVVGIIFSFAAIGLGWALGFYKYNGKPFVFIVEAAFHYVQSNRLYVWRKREKQAEADLDLSNFKTTKHTGILANKDTGSKLNELTWSIDIERENEVATQKVHTDNLA